MDINEDKKYICEQMKLILFEKRKLVEIHCDGEKIITVK